MTKRRTPRRTTDIPNLFRLSRIHDYYQSCEKCTINKAVIFMDETKAMVEMYSLIRSQCRDVINAVIPAENVHTDTPQRQPHKKQALTHITKNTA